MSEIVDVVVDSGEVQCWHIIGNKCLSPNSWPMVVSQGSREGSNTEQQHGKPSQEETELVEATLVTRLTPHTRTPS